MRSKYKFTEAKDLYVERYAPVPKTMTIWEHAVPLPVLPPPEQIMNSDLPKSKQKFYRTVIPDDLRKWDKEQRDAFIAAEYHKRRNGVWMMIYGKPVYLTGTMYFFMNYWLCEYGGLPEFRWEAVEFFTMWRWIERDPLCYGMLDYKARRMGDTEKALCIEYDYASQVRFSRCGMQNITEKDASDNLARITEAHNNMPFFSKPVSRGSDKSQEKLVFDYPEMRITRKSLLKEKELQEYQSMKDTGIRSLGSVIDFQPTVLKKYDGKRLGRYHLDEAGKMTTMDPVRQLDVIRPCLHLFGGMKIVGKAIITTTVEEIGKGKSLEWANQMWMEADPSVKNDNGRTINGLRRVFRPVTLSAPVNEYGFHEEEQMRKFIDAEVRTMTKKGLLNKLADFKRKNPLDINDVLQPSSEDCLLLPELLDRRLNQINNNLWIDDSSKKPDGSEVVPEWVKGDLVWKEGNPASRQVLWVPSTTGRWTITQHPKIANHMTFDGGFPTPGQRFYYSIGVDPFDHVTSNVRRSDGGIAVYRRYDAVEDGHLELNEAGEVLYPENMKSEQFVCAYQYRHDEPSKFYEDVLKTAIYYGGEILYESNKTAIREYFVNHNFAKYLMMRPRATKSSMNTINKAEVGTPATSSTIEMYTEKLIDHIARRWMCEKIPDLLKDWRMFTGDNRGERDLTVASGFALLGAGKRYSGQPSGDKAKSDLSYKPFRTFRRNI
jgi:hypothetical protein